MAENCKKCKSQPNVVEILGCFYAQCTGKYCTKWDPYEFIGTTERKALQNWDKANAPKNKQIKEMEEWQI